MSSNSQGSGTTRFKRKLPSFNTVRRGATATANLPTGASYRSIDLIVKNAEGMLSEANIKSAIGRIRLLLNGKCYYESTAKHIIDVFNRYKGLPVVPGIIHIPLTDRTFKGIDAEDLLRWGTGNISTFDIEVEILDVAAADGISLKGEALVDNIREDLGVIKEVHEFSYAAPGAGNFEVADLPKYNGDLAEMHFDSSNKIKGIEFKANSVTFLEGELDVYNEHLKRDGERIPQSGYAHHDLCFKNRLMDCLALSNKDDTRYYLDMLEAVQMKLIMVTVNAPLGYSRAKK